MTIEADILDLLDDGRVRSPIAIAKCLPQHKAASVMALVSTLAGKSQLVKVPGKGFTLPQYAPPGAVGPDWAAANIAPFQRVLLYVRKHQPVKRATVARVLKSHVAEVNRVITECIGIGHIHQIGDMLREGADPRRAAKPDTPSEAERREAETSVTSEEPEAAAAPTRAGDAPDESAESESPPSVLGPAGASRETRNGIDVGLVSDAIMERAALLSGSDYDAGVLEPLPELGQWHRVLAQGPFDITAGAILNDSHAIDQEPAMTEANAIQVGGTHYRDCPIQPWDFIAANGIGFFEGNAIKYLARWREKGGVEDLRKARHYLDKLIEIETRGAP